MNERINELVDKTAVMIPGVYTIVYESGKKGVEFNEEALNKFVELLIQEFLFIIDDERKSDMVNRTELWKQVKQHFGVEK